MEASFDTGFREIEGGTRRLPIYSYQATGYKGGYKGYNGGYMACNPIQLATFVKKYRNKVRSQIKLQTLRNAEGTMSNVYNFLRQSFSCSTDCARIYCQQIQKVCYRNGKCGDLVGLQ